MGAKWYDFVSTGYGPIDADHHDLTRLIDLFLSAINAGNDAEAASHARAVVEKVGAHFAHEESLMRAHAYPQYARHKEAHDLFLGDAASYLREVTDRGVTVAFRRWATGRLLTWFRFHIHANDVGLGQFLTAATAPAAGTGASGSGGQRQPA